MILTLAQAGDLLGIRASTLRRQIANGKLSGTLVGKTWTVTEREVERYRSESLGRPGRRAGCEHPGFDCSRLRKPYCYCMVCKAKVRHSHV
jgi:excisionase family DNA binding protein